MRRSLAGVYPAVRATESTPPLYYWLAWAWSRLFGSGPVGLRSLSALLGTLAIPLAYAVTREFFPGPSGRRTALTAAALVCVSPVLVWYSQEARAYTLLLLLGLATVWCAARARRGGGAALAGWSVCAALAIGTHYFAIFLVAAEALWVLAGQPRDVRRRAAIIPPLAAGAAIAPLLAHQDAHVARPWTTGYTVLHGLSGTVQQALVGPVWTPLTHVAGVAALAILTVGALIALARAPRARRSARVPLLLVAASVCVPAVIAVVGTDYLVVRNEIVAVALGLILVAAGCAASRHGAALTGAICGCGLAIVIAVPLTPELQRNDWRDAIRAGAAGAGPRIWVFLDRFDSTPISEVYLPGARSLAARGVSVARIEVIGRAGFPGVGAAAAPVAGFRPAGAFTRSGIVLERFEAPRRVTVRPPQLADLDARVVVSGDVPAEDSRP